MNDVNILDGKDALKILARADWQRIAPSGYLVVDHLPYICRKSNFEALVVMEDITVMHSESNGQDCFSFGKYFPRDNSVIYK